MNLNSIECADALDFLRGLGDKSVDCIISDPPYNSTRNAWDKAQDWHALFTEFRRVVVSPRSPIILFCNNRLFAHLVTTQAKLFRFEIIIEKSNPSGFLNANRAPLACHEFVAIFSSNAPYYYPQMVTGGKHDRGGKNLTTSNDLRSYGDANRLDNRPSNEYYPRSIWQATKPPDARINLITDANRRDVHPTEKDVDLMTRLVKTFSAAGDTVLDCFAGSGSTCIAARNTGRNFIGCDLSPEYAALARTRLATSDPYQHSPLPNGGKQLSLFAGLGDDAK